MQIDQIDTMTELAVECKAFLTALGDAYTAIDPVAATAAVERIAAIIDQWRAAR